MKYMIGNAANPLALTNGGKLSVGAEIVLVLEENQYDSGMHKFKTQETIRFVSGLPELRELAKQLVGYADATEKAFEAALTDFVEKVADEVDKDNDKAAE